MKSKLTGLVVALAVATVSVGAFAEVKREGQWPAGDKKISLDAVGVSRRDAVRKVAEAAGLSVVADGIGEGAVDVKVKDQPAGRVLELVLDDGSYVATRDGDLLRIRRATPVASDKVEGNVEKVDKAADAKEAKADKPSADKSDAEKTDKEKSDKNERAGGGVTRKHGDDRTIFGASATIEANETVKDATVFGGNMDVKGVVSGDLTVFGGNVHVHPGARIAGDVSLLGGNLDLDDGAVVERDISVLGGSVHRAPGASIGGSVHEQAAKDIKLSVGKEHNEGFVARLGHSLTNMAILFVFGTILLALGATRMESMSVEVAARPMRSFALGVVGFFGSILAAVVLCVTLVGIPVALFGALVLVFAGYAGTVAALTTFGAAVLRHRTPSPYVHLAFGCAVLFVVGLLPVVGGLVTAVVVALGLGAFFATRGAGFLAKKVPSSGPYRTA